jgi:hypothetical protein
MVPKVLRLSIAIPRTALVTDTVTAGASVALELALAGPEPSCAAVDVRPGMDGDDAAVGDMFPASICGNTPDCQPQIPAATMPMITSTASQRQSLIPIPL